MKASRIVLAAAAAAATLTLMITPALASTSAPAGSGIVVHHGMATAGYEVGPLKGSATSFKYITATYTVPGLGAGCAAGVSGDELAFLGTDATLVTETCPAGGLPATYEASVIDYSSGAVNEFPVSPGDDIFTGITYNVAAKTFMLRMTDATNGKSLDVADPCSGTANCGLTVAGVVLQMAGDDGLIGFGQVNFTQIKVNDSAGKTGGLVNANWATSQDDMIGGVNPSPIFASSSPAESAFSVATP